MEMSKAEMNLKRSLELEVSQEEMDFFNGKLTSEEIKKLVMRLSILKRKIEEKGKELREEMCDLTLLDVLAHKMHKFLCKLQAYGRARRPKEKKKTRKRSAKKHKDKAQIFKEDKVKARANASNDNFEAFKPNHKGGREHLHNGHNKKFFKENFKPP